ncbi:MAG: beta-ketoacyl-[acyl-carrier-protein] synthase family protein [Gemmataceae bacterium]|nr:beta-ketoacyl-[acyl-carrier-protein] synthase family protein [Gemmataceae bacterium]
MSAVEVGITGVGAVTPLGHRYEEIADRLLAGQSGVRRIEHFDASQHPCRIAGLIDTIPCPPGVEPRVFAQGPRLEQLLHACCGLALADAGLWSARSELRVGIVLGMGAEWLIRWEDDAFAGGDAMYHPERPHQPLVRLLQERLGLHGPVASVAAACASGNYAIAQARRWLQLGWADVCLAGAGDLGVSRLALAGFGNLRALTRRNDNAAAASRPFDRGRDGFVAAEGGAVFVLEPLTAARRRGARLYAAIAGFGASSDAYHMVIPSPDPTPGATAIRRALADARCNVDDIDYINAHATSTPVGDIAEARILHAALGPEVKSIPVSSSKSMSGHLLTAAAAFEALVCLIALDRQAVPPTINLEDPDPECDLCHVAQTARPHRLRSALSNSFGFGGSNTCLIVRAA